MFKAILKNSTLMELNKILNPIVSEYKMTITKGGISITVVDDAHVAMAKVDMPTDCFEEFEGSSMELGIDLDKMKDVAASGGKDEMVEIEFDGKANKLNMRVGNILRRMSLIDATGMATPKIPALNLPVSITIKAEELRKVITAGEKLTNHMDLKASPDAFLMVANGDTDTIEMRVPADQLEEIECSEAVMSKFSMDYLGYAVRSVPKDGSTIIKMGNDYPVVFEFQIAEGKGSVLYMMAPRIED